MADKLIYSYVSDPATSLFKSNRNEPARHTVVHCSNSSNCDLYKRGECALLSVSLFSVNSCEYGKKSATRGFTRRANKYHEWIYKRKTDFPVERPITHPAKRLAKVGEWVYLPYDHMCMSPLFDKPAQGFMSGQPWMKWEIFNQPDTIIRLIKFQPVAMMGGCIHYYQREQVPKFITHLKEDYPELLKKAADLDDEVRDRVGVPIEYKGRHAFVNTLKIGATIGNYRWDGEFLSTKKSFPPSGSPIVMGGGKCEVRIKPNSEMVVKITDNDQVDPVKTKFKD